MPFHGQGIQTVEQPGELPEIDGQGFGFGGWSAKHVALQALLPQTEPVAMPVKDFQARALAVGKHEQRIAKDVQRQFGLNQGR